MNDEAESSREGLRYAHASTSDDYTDTDLDDAIDEIDEEEEARQREQLAKERRHDAKRKRIIFLEHLLRELDTLVFLELITLYYLE